MRRRFYTIFILPHAHARFRKLHLSRNFIAVACAVLALGLVGGGVAPHLLFKVQAQSVVLADLEQENRTLRDHRNRTETTLEQMAQRLDQVESEASRLARELGLKDLPAAPAAGGALVEYPANDPRVMDEEIQALGNRLQALNLSFESIGPAWQERA